MTNFGKQALERRQTTQAYRGRKHTGDATTVFTILSIAAAKRIGEKNPPFWPKLIITDEFMMSDTLRAVILGIIEGVTEFLPVSSTGHLLLAERFFGLGEDNFWKSFAILIQLGAILAIVAIYFTKLWRIALGMFSNADDRRFVIGLLIAFLPAVIIGLIAGKAIKEHLFDPWVVCFSLIVGGAILLWVDQLDLKPRYHDATTFPLPMYLGIGIAQCLAMIPGTSRSGATIVSAMLFGSGQAALRIHPAIPDNGNVRGSRLSLPQAYRPESLEDG